MTKRKVEIEEDNGIGKSFGYDIVKWGTFVTPLAIVFCFFYWILRNIVQALAGTAVVIIIAILIIALWYMKRGDGDMKRGIPNEL